MKALNVIVKIVVALAAVAGAIYVAATYGDRIVAWAKKLLNSCSCCCCDGECCCEDDECCCECDCQCCCEEEDDAEDVTVEVVEAEVAPETVATEGDFEG